MYSAIDLKSLDMLWNASAKSSVSLSVHLFKTSSSPGSNLRCLLAGFRSEEEEEEGDRQGEDGCATAPSAELEEKVDGLKGKFLPDSVFVLFLALPLLPLSAPFPRE